VREKSCARWEETRFKPHQSGGDVHAPCPMRACQSAFLLYITIVAFDIYSFKVSNIYVLIMSVKSSYYRARITI
jgi:hypothetical protein